MGLTPDGSHALSADGVSNEASSAAGGAVEPAFSRAEALRTPAFWQLSLYTLLVYPVQAGVSLHQAPHLIERGFDPTIAATIISTFALASGISGLMFGVLSRRLGIRISLAVSAVALGIQYCGYDLDRDDVAGLSSCSIFWDQHWWHPNGFANCLGRLLWTKKLRRHTWRRVVHPGRGTGDGTFGLWNPA